MQSQDAADAQLKYLFQKKEQKTNRLVHVTASIIQFLLSAETFKNIVPLWVKKKQTTWNCKMLLVACQKSVAKLMGDWRIARCVFRGCFFNYLLFFFFNIQCEVMKRTSFVGRLERTKEVLKNARACHTMHARSDGTRGCREAFLGLPSLRVECFPKPPPVREKP